jgi:dipeptidyl aminopeptidase/acylaminoacyl peptidase
MHRICACAALTAAFGILLLQASTTAAEVSPLAVADVLRAPTLAAYAPPAISPDGRLLAYVVVDSKRVDAAEDARELIESGVAWYAIGADVWITDLQTGTHRNITGAKGHNWDVTWSSDGKQLFFMADRTGDAKLGPARLWMWERDKNEARQVSDADVREGLGSMQWARDDHSVLVSVYPHELGREGYVDLIQPKSAKTTALLAQAGPQVFEFDPSQPGAVPVTNQINTDLLLRDLALIDVRTGLEQRITRGLRIGHYYASPDRRHVVYSVLQGEAKPGSGQYLYDIVVHELATANNRVLAAKVPLTLLGVPFSWAPDSRAVAWRTGGPSIMDEVYVATLKLGIPVRVARNAVVEDLHAMTEVNPAIWDGSCKYVYFIRGGALWRAAADGSHASSFAKSPHQELQLISPRQYRLFAPQQADRAFVLTARPSTKQVGFASVDLNTGAVAQVFEEAKRYGGYGTEPTVSADGKLLVYISESPLEPPNLHLFDGGTSRKVSDVAPALSNRAFGKAEVIEWTSIDGDRQRGALIYPADYQAGKAYPLIVKVYGGSSISDHLNLFGYANAPVENLHLYTTRGYALLLADSRLNVGTPMVDLMKTVMPGIDKAIATGVADPQRVGVTGHSYGGYSVLSLIVQSPRFKAAVMRAGMGNLIAGYGQLGHDGTNYGLAWSESGQGRMGGTPWEYRERYVENSPIFYLDRVQTPLLIIHGDQDDAVPSHLADEVFTGLRRLGKTVTYARYPGEGHWEGVWKYEDRVDALNRQIAWFDLHLKGSGASHPH